MTGHCVVSLFEKIHRWFILNGSNKVVCYHANSSTMLSKLESYLSHKSQEGAEPNASFVPKNE